MRTAKIGDEIIVKNQKNPFVIRGKENELWIDTLMTGNSPEVKCKKLGTLMIYAKLHQNKHGVFTAAMEEK